MTRFFHTKTAATLAALSFTLLTFTVTPAAAQFWGYACETCPANWHNLPGDCAAPNQSPIAFSKGDAKSKKLPKLKVGYFEATLEAIALRNSVDFVEYVGGEHTIGIKRKTYVFQKLEFHTVGEHVIGGERSALEMHLEHVADDGSGSRLILAVFIEAGDANPAFDGIIAALRTVVLNPVPVTVTVDLNDLLPRKMNSYRYKGSTTTPPCYGDAQWVLLKTHVELSAAQIVLIRGSSSTGGILALSDGFDTNRPVQNREGRKIYMDRDDDSDSDSDSD